MSYTVITDLLRKQMGFDGVVITDDLTMGAIMKNYNIGDAAVDSVNAGADIVLVCHGYENERAVIDSIKAAVSGGAIPMERIDESVYRILRLKAKYKLTNDIVPPANIDEMNLQIDDVLNEFGLNKSDG
jgi:beta-N-acetylhexosaminidase